MLLIAAKARYLPLRQEAVRLVREFLPGDAAPTSNLLIDFTQGLIDIEESRAHDDMDQNNNVTCHGGSANALPEEARLAEAVIAHEINDGKGPRIVGARINKANGVDFVEYVQDALTRRWVLEDGDLHAQQVQETRDQVLEVTDINPIGILWSRVALCRG